MLLLGKTFDPGILYPFIDKTREYESQIRAIYKFKSIRKMQSFVFICEQNVLSIFIYDLSIFTIQESIIRI